MIEPRSFAIAAVGGPYFNDSAAELSPAPVIPLEGGTLGPKSLPDLVGESFAAFPDAPAIEFDGVAHSRAAIAERSDRLASWLLRRGSVDGTLVGIYMDRSVEMLVAVLGVLKAGAAYVPLDPAFPRSRTEQIIDETQIAVLLTLARHRHDLPRSGAEVLSLDGDAGALDAQAARPLPSVSPEARAYVIFTSGSTGRPKGVEITHASVINLLTDLRGRLEMNPSDRLLAVTTLAFDISVLELLLPLVSGGTVILASRQDASDGIRLTDLIRRADATALQATPFTWRLLLDAGFRPKRGFKMMCGGEAWLPEMAERLLATGGRLWNMYGPTETTVWSSVTEVHRGVDRITIGPPISRTRFYVLNEELEPLKRGEPGELWIGGDGLARGYLGRPDLTQERFLADRFLAGERMYRTGDRVCQLPDGRIQFLGRSDQQVKFRGYRIELGDIESAIRKSGDVREAVAVLLQDAEGEAMLAGFYTAESPLDGGAVRRSLQEQLPGYMVPRVIRQLERFPLTENGKTDRRALLSPGFLDTSVNGKSQQDSGVSGPHTGLSIEQEMAHIWERIFPGEVITGDSDFFHLGGDSLLVLRLQSMLLRQRSITLTLAELYRQPTVKALAAWVEGRQNDPGSPPESVALNRRLVPLQTSGTGRPIFLLPQVLLFETLAAKLGTDQPVYALELLEEDIPAGDRPPSFGQLAQLYCDIIREVQPSGPYRLGGWCMWGWVAYEIARRLEQEGDDVELVMVMDAWAPGFWEQQSFRRKLSLFLAQRGLRLRWMAKRLWKSDMKRRKADIRRRLGNAAVSIVNLLTRKRRQRTPVQEVLAAAARTYQGAPIHAKVIVFKGDHQPAGRLFGEDMGWARIVGHTVTSSTLPGNHAEIFDPAGAEIIAAEFRASQGTAVEAPLR